MQTRFREDRDSVLPVAGTRHTGGNPWPHSSCQCGAPSLILVPPVAGFQAHHSCAITGSKRPLLIPAVDARNPLTPPASTTACRGPYNPSQIPIAGTQSTYQSPSSWHPGSKSVEPSLGPERTLQLLVLWSSLNASSWSKGTYSCRLTRVAGTQIHSQHFPRSWHSAHKVCRTLSRSTELCPSTTTDVRTPICSSSWHHHQWAYTPCLTPAAGTSFTLTDTDLVRSWYDRGCKYKERQLRKDLLRKQGKTVVFTAWQDKCTD